MRFGPLSSLGALRVVVSFAACTAACITGDRRHLGDTTATGEPDSVSPDVTAPDVVTDTAVEPDATLPDASDTRDIDAPDVAPTRCDNPGDCGEPPTCSSWACIDNTCESAPRSGSCDDHDACTGEGTCVGGACHPGPALVCDNATLCGRAACDKALGCFDEPVSGGFCVSNDPSAGTWGACDGLRMAPPDRCGVDGTCLEQTTTVVTPLPKGLVAGAWWVVAQSALAQGRGTLAGIVDFQSGGTWQSDAFFTTGGRVDPESFGKRSWCLDASGGIAVDVGENHVIGQVDPAGELLAASGQLGNEVFVGVRPTGALGAAHGTYAVVLTTLGDDQQPIVWSGTLVFDHGCIDEGAAFQTNGAISEPFFVTASGACLQGVGDGLATLTLGIEQPDIGVDTSFTLLGAVSPRGDTLLFVRQDGDATLAAGLAIATRLSAVPAGLFDARTQWGFAFQDVSQADQLFSYRGYPGLWTFANHLLVNGTFDDGDQVLGDRIAIDEYGRFVMDLRTFNDKRTLSGYFAPSGGLGVFYEIAPIVDWDLALSAAETPTRRSFGVMIRRPNAN